MKNHLLCLCLALACLATSSCKKDEDDKLDPEGDCFTAKVDGQMFESDNVTGTLAIFDLITVSATSGNGPVPTFGLTLVTTDVGTYSFAAQSDVVGLYAPDPLTSSEEFGATSGTLTIQEHNAASKRLRGTFSFEGTNIDGETIQVTEGFFDLGYQ